MANHLVFSLDIKEEPGKEEGMLFASSKILHSFRLAKGGESL